MINKLENAIYSDMLPTVYDYKAMTLQELLCDFFTKINECIEDTNEATKIVVWIKDKVPQEVYKIIDEMYKDGTLANLINTKIFEDFALDIKLFGAKCDGVTDDYEAINRAIEIGKLMPNGCDILYPEGTILHSKKIVMYSNIRHIGKGRRKTILKKTRDFDGYQFETKDFSMLKDGTEFANVPKNFAILDMTLDGNYMNEENNQYTSYNNTVGGGIRIYGRQFKLDCEVVNQCGVGIWVQCNGQEKGGSHYEVKDYFVNVSVRDCREECYVNKNLSDGFIDKLIVRGGGKRILSEDSTPLQSPNYGSVEYPYTDNIIFDNGGAEINQIHTWGCFGGKGLRSLGTVRFNTNLIIAESCHNGGVEFTKGSYGSISILDVHGCGGGKKPNELNGTTADIIISGTRAFNIGSIHCENVSTVSTGQPSILVDGSFVNCSDITVNKYGRSGDGIVVTGNFNRLKGTIQNGGDGFALVRNGTGDKTNVLDFSIINYNKAINLIGKPHTETLKINAFLKDGQTLLHGDIKDRNINSDWNIVGSINGKKYVSEFFGNYSFDSSIDTEQTITIPHNMITTPLWHKTLWSIADSPTGFTNELQYCYLSTITETDFVFKVKMKVAQGSNTSPMITVYSKF